MASHRGRSASPQWRVIRSLPCHVLLCLWHVFGLSSKCLANVWKYPIKGLRNDETRLNCGGFLCSRFVKLSSTTTFHGDCWNIIEALFEGGGGIVPLWGTCWLGVVCPPRLQKRPKLVESNQASGIEIRQREGKTQQRRSLDNLVTADDRVHANFKNSATL